MVGGVDGGVDGEEEDGDELLGDGELLTGGELLDEDEGSNPDDDTVIGSVKKSEGTDPVDPGVVGRRSGVGDGTGAAA